MKLLLIFPVILALVFASTGTGFAQEYDYPPDSTISISTDKERYSDNERIIVNGQSKNNSIINYSVISPGDNIILLGTVFPNYDSFKFIVNTHGPLWKIAGVYTIKVSQNQNVDKVKIIYDGHVKVTETQKSTNSKCGPGTMYNAIANACVLNGYQGNVSESNQSLGMSIIATADSGSDRITVTGKTVSDIADVKFRVTSPSGNNVVAVWQVSPDDNGEFMVNFIVGPTWTENGFYEIEVMQAVQQNLLYTLKVKVEVNYGMTEKTFVTKSNLDTEIIVPIREKNSKCGPGTVFDDDANSCILREHQGNFNKSVFTPAYTVQEPKDSSENARLKLEIRDLKEQNNILQSQINDLRNIIYEQIDVIMKTLQKLG